MLNGHWTRSADAPDAGVEYPRTLSLIVWRRSTMILMMVFNLIHAFVLLEAAWYTHTVTLAMWEEKSEAPLEMINVPETLFWSADPVLNAEIIGHEFQRPKGYKPRFYTSATQCLQGDETTRCPEDAIEGHVDDLRSWHQSYIKHHTVDGVECPESIYIDPAELTQEFRQDESCGTVDQLVEQMRTVVRRATASQALFLWPSRLWITASLHSTAVDACPHTVLL